MVKANVYRKKDWTEGDLQEAVNQHWALDPDNCVWAVSKIAASFGVPRQLDFEFGSSACCHKFARRSVQNILQAITINNGLNTFK